MNKSYYVLRIDSYYGESSSMCCNADDEDFMYAVLLVKDEDAEIVDYGYSSVAQLLEAWNNVKFNNIERFS
ncbi:MAG: hypothetical protein IKU14_04400 [Rhodocyclaceae bacterium]|nr:hypothetical protein [Rhodocyclaceae bacterium]